MSLTSYRAAPPRDLVYGEIRPVSVAQQVESSPWRKSFRESAAREFAALDIFCCQNGAEMIANDGVIEFGATRKNVHGGIGVLGPGVDGDVAFGDDDDTAHSVRAEGVEDFRDDGAVAEANRFEEERFERGGIVQQGDGAAAEFEEGVAREWDAHFYERDAKTVSAAWHPRV